MNAKHAAAVGKKSRGGYWKWLVLSGVAGFAVWAAVLLLISPPLPQDYPALPDLEVQNAALRELLVHADAVARRRPGSVEDIGRLGMIYHANQYYGRAESAYRIASRLAADDYRWPYLRALVREETGREGEVSELLEAAVARRSDFVPALQKLGDISFKREDLDTAARYYERSAETATGDSKLQAVFGLGRIAALKKDWQKVVELVAPLVQNYPNVRPLHQLLLNAYEALGRADLAAQERRHLLDPDLIVIPLVKYPLDEELLALSCSSTRLLKEAGLLSRFGKPKEAIRVARRAVEVEPGDSDVHHFLARMLLDAHGADAESVSEALDHLREGLRLKPDDPVPLWYFATFFFKQDKTDEAVEQLRSMLAAHAGKAESHYYLGLVADRQGKIPEALGQYQQALKADSQNADAWHRIGLIRVRQGALREATACFRRAVELKPSFTMARSNLGVALDQMGQTREAIREFREALRLKPNDAAVHQYLGIAFLRTGAAGDAVSHFREAVRFAPGDAEAHYGLGIALALQQKTDEARQALEQAIRLRPEYEEAREQLRKLESARPLRR